MARKAKKTKNTEIETLVHDQQTKRHIPTAEMEGLVRDGERKPVQVAYPRKNNPDENPELYLRNSELDPQLVWKGKDEEDRKPLSVDAVPIYVQEHIQPKVIIDDIKRMAAKSKRDRDEGTIDLFADWEDELDPEDRIEFYQHDRRWTNRMILGDSLLVMNSLAEKEGLKGQVQCIYFDPPYGINYSSNWQVSTKSRSVSDRDLSREPETIQAFRDVWSKEISSYLPYLRDRLMICRDLLAESGSLFLQISDKNCHLVRSLLDEVFGGQNFIRQIFFSKTGSLTSNFLGRTGDIIIWYAKNKESCKFRPLFEEKTHDSFYKHVEISYGVYRQLEKDEYQTPSKEIEGGIFRYVSLESSGAASASTPFDFCGKTFEPNSNRHWQVSYPEGMHRIVKANRVGAQGKKLRYRLYIDDYPVKRLGDVWVDTAGFAGNQIYVVETRPLVVQRCILMTTDPGDIVLDPTCGSGTTAYVAEQWGRRWITIDTSRVSLALARARLIGSHFPYYLLADSHEGALKESEVSGKTSIKEVYGGNIRNGFVYERVPHITLGSIANNAEIDTIWERWQEILEPLLDALNSATGKSYEEWEVPRDLPPPPPKNGNQIKDIHEKYWQARIARQGEIDASIGRNAATEYLYDRPYVQKNVVRVTGPFTVESLSPHRILPTDADDESILEAMDAVAEEEGEYSPPSRRSRLLRPKSEEQGETKFIDIVYENLRKAGVQNTKKGERMEFSSLEPWANGRHIQFEGRYGEGGKERKAAICIGPEYGTVTRSLMVQAAREAADYFDTLVVLGFAFEAHADEELINIGNLPVLRARMNNDLHMADRLKTGKSGNLFVVFGEPDIDLRSTDDDRYQVDIKGVDIFDPTTGEVKASGADDIACWFVDTDYNDEAFFVRHAYFSGGGPDPFKRIKTTLKSEIDQDTWQALYTTTSRPFDKPSSGRIAVKAINHFGDEVLKIFDIE